jgi:hypothetical protein
VGALEDPKSIGPLWDYWVSDMKTMMLNKAPLL